MSHIFLVSWFLCLTLIYVNTQFLDNSNGLIQPKGRQFVEIYYDKSMEPHDYIGVTLIDFCVTRSPDYVSLDLASGEFLSVFLYKLVKHNDKNLYEVDDCEDLEESCDDDDEHCKDDNDVWDDSSDYNEEQHEDSREELCLVEELEYFQRQGQRISYTISEELDPEHTYVLQINYKHKFYEEGGDTNFIISVDNSSERCSFCFQYGTSKDLLKLNMNKTLTALDNYNPFRIQPRKRRICHYGPTNPIPVSFIPYLTHSKSVNIKLGVTFLERLNEYLGIPTVWPIKIAVPLDNSSSYVPYQDFQHFWLNNTDRALLRIAQRMVQYQLRQQPDKHFESKALTHYSTFKIVEETAGALDRKRFDVMLMEMLMDLLKHDVFSLKLVGSLKTQRLSFIYRMFHNIFPGKLDQKIADKTKTWSGKNIGYPLITITQLSNNTVSITQELFVPRNRKNKVRKVPLCDAIFRDLCAPFVLDTPEMRRQYTEPLEPWCAVFFRLPLGYYRMNYSPEIWNAIIDKLNTNFTEIPASDRARLIDDALNLARHGYISYELAWKVFEFVKHDPYIGSWIAVHQNIWELRELTRNSDLLRFMDKLVRNINPLKKLKSLEDVRFYGIYKRWRLIPKLPTWSITRKHSKTEILERKWAIDCRARAYLDEQQFFGKFLPIFKQYTSNSWQYYALQCMSAIQINSDIKNLLEYATQKSRKTLRKQQRRELLRLIYENSPSSTLVVILEHLRVYFTTAETEAPLTGIIVEFAHLLKYRINSDNLMELYKKLLKVMNKTAEVNMEVYLDFIDMNLELISEASKEIQGIIGSNSSSGVDPEMAIRSFIMLHR